MPTKKRRVGFIPRNDVLEIINKLSVDNNLSYSKIINILVEEALYKRGLFNISPVIYIDENNNNWKKINQERFERVNNEFDNKYKNKLLKDKNLNSQELKAQTLDNEIYSKFIMFLQFQERMKTSES